MNLRNVTIWTTGMLMLMPLIIPAVFMFPSWGSENVEDLINVPIVCWIFSGTPLFFSLVLVKKLEHKISTAVLLLATTAYGIWFAFVSLQVSSAISAGECGCIVMRLFIVGPLSLPVMLPVWTIALVTNRYRVKPSEPQSFDGETEPDA